MSTIMHDSFNGDDSGSDEGSVTVRSKDDKVVRQKAYAYKQVDLGDASTDENTKYIQRVGKRFKCLICDKTYGRHNSVRHHITVYHRNKPHVCGICSFSTREARYIHLHRFKLHGIELPTYMHFTMPQCDKCGQLCKNGPALSRHVKRCKRTVNTMVEFDRPLNLVTKRDSIEIEVEEVFNDETKLTSTDESSAIDAFFGAETIQQLPMTPPASSIDASSTDSSASMSPVCTDNPAESTAPIDMDDLMMPPVDTRLPDNFMEALDRYLVANIDGAMNSTIGSDELEVLSRLLD